MEISLYHDDICCHDDWCCLHDYAEIWICVLVEAVEMELVDFHGDYVLVDLDDIFYHCDVLICHVCHDVSENGDVEEVVVAVAREEAEMVFVVIYDSVYVLVLVIFFWEILAEVDRVEDDDGEDLVICAWS